MTAKVIAIINQKGGCGKSTVTMNLAGTLALRHNKKILVIDGDRQGTSTRWYNAAPEGSEFPCTVISLATSGKDTHRSIKNFISDYDYIIVDCPPSLESELNGSVLLVSSLVIIPISPSTPDLWAMQSTFNLINSVKTFNENLVIKVLLNMCEPHKQLSNEISKFIKQSESVDLLETSLNYRSVYGVVPLTGQTAYTSKNNLAKNEIAMLADEILEIIDSK